MNEKFDELELELKKSKQIGKAKYSLQRNAALGWSDQCKGEKISKTRYELRSLSAYEQIVDFDKSAWKQVTTMLQDHCTWQIR